MKLITELVEQVNYLTEEKNGRKSMYIEGVFLQGGIKNKNGRIYPPPLMEREANRYILEKVSKGCAYGELGHPNGPGINMDRVSHLITSLTKEGMDYHGRARIIEEGLGKIAIGIIQAEGNLGVSSRGMGSLKEDRKVGAMIVQDDYHLAVGADIVADPSAPSAWVNGVMEGVEWVMNERGEFEQRAIESIRETVHKTPKSMLAETKVSLFEGFLNGLVEQNMIQALAKNGNVSSQKAAAAVRKAQIKAKAKGAHTDTRYVFQTAREILGIGGS